MPVNDKILVSDYNNIRNKIVNVLGPGSGSSGYGQTLSSSAVSLSSRITVNEYVLLRNDIINAHRHIFGTTPVLAEPTAGSLVKFTSTFVPSIAESPYNQYDTYANSIVNNRYTAHISQVITVNKGEQTRSDWVNGYWNTRLSCTVTVTFTNSTQARYFFNSGGTIRFESSRNDIDPNNPSTRQQNVAWTALLNRSPKMVSFGAQLPTTGFSPMNGQNFYRLTNAYQVWETRSSTTPYASNTYRISARSNVTNNSAGTANIVEFLVEWIDGYTDPGPGGPPFTGDQIDGIFTLDVSTQESFGVLVPATAGNFTVESPSVLLGSIIQDPNGPLGS
jgi:hypothetical protein